MEDWSTGDRLELMILKLITGGSNEKSKKSKFFWLLRSSKALTIWNPQTRRSEHLRSTVVVYGRIRVSFSPLPPDLYHNRYSCYLWHILFVFCMYTSLVVAFLFVSDKAIVAGSCACTPAHEQTGNKISNPSCFADSPEFVYTSVSVRVSVDKQSCDTLERNLIAV